MDVPRRQMRLAAVVLALSLAAALFVELRNSPPQRSPAILTGAARVGGPFQLIDHTGRAVTDRDYRGKSMVIYFGWRLDPDLTPAALQVLSASLDTLGRKTERLAAIFVSVDAERDNPTNLNEFVRKIDPRLTALTGPSEAIAPLAKAYKLYFKHIPDASWPGGYSIDHASLYYVMGPDGEFLGVVPHTTDTAVLSQELSRLVK